MRAAATLVMVDDEPTFLIDDGTIIDTDKIGYICSQYGINTDDCFYEKFTKDDVSFIIDNNVNCEIEMVDEDGFRSPKLYRNKIIIHFK